MLSFYSYPEQRQACHNIFRKSTWYLGQLLRGHSQGYGRAVEDKREVKQLSQNNSRAYLFNFYHYSYLWTFESE